MPKSSVTTRLSLPLDLKKTLVIFRLAVGVPAASQAGVAVRGNIRGVQRRNAGRRSFAEAKGSVLTW